MFKDILSKEQIGLLPLIQKFKKDFYMVGGTAIALQIGHRQSIDFDMFKETSINVTGIRAKMKREIGSTLIPIYSDFDQIHFNINNIKITFFQYPFPIEPNVNFETTLRMPDLIQLAAMKFFALGGRGKWKDYVDIYFLLKYHFSFAEICQKAKDLFQDNFNPKLAAQQLSFFSDISYEESVTYLREKPTEQEIKDFLVHTATNIF